MSTTKMQTNEFIRIKPSNEHVKGCFNVYGFDEGDHKILYAPSLELSAYGTTEDEAKEMFKVSINTFFEDFLKEHGVEALYAELKKMGWTQKKYHKKQLVNLSKTTFEDIRKEFNLPEDAPYQQMEMVV